MKTLETMVEGTKVGSYLALFYGLIIVFTSGITFIVQFNGAYKQHDLITQNVAKTYGLSETSAENLMCFQGVLHYKNVGLLSGALAFSPNISCSQEELKQLQENPSENIAFVAFIFLLVGVLISGTSHHYIIKSVSHPTSRY